MQEYLKKYITPVLNIIFYASHLSVTSSVHEQFLSSAITPSTPIKTTSSDSPVTPSTPVKKTSNNVDSEKNSPSAVTPTTPIKTTPSDSPVKSKKTLVHCPIPPRTPIKNTPSDSPFAQRTPVFTRRTFVSNYDDSGQFSPSAVTPTTPIKFTTPTPYTPLLRSSNSSLSPESSLATTPKTPSSAISKKKEKLAISFDYIASLETKYKNLALPIEEKDHELFIAVAQALNHFIPLLRNTVTERQVALIFQDIDPAILKTGGIDSLQHLKMLLSRYLHVPGISDSADGLMIKILKNCMYITLDEQEKSAQKNQTPQEKDIRFGRLAAAKGFLYELSVAPKLEKFLQQKVMHFGKELTGINRARKRTQLDFDLEFDTVLVECKNKSYNFFEQDQINEEIASFKRHKTRAAFYKKKFLIVFGLAPSDEKVSFTEQLKQEELFFAVITTSMTEDMITPLDNQVDSDLKNYLMNLTRDRALEIPEKTIQTMSTMPSLKSKKDHLLEHFVEEATASQKRKIYNIFRPTDSPQTDRELRSSFENMGMQTTPEKEAQDTNALIAIENMNKKSSRKEKVQSSTIPVSAVSEITKKKKLSFLERLNAASPPPTATTDSPDFHDTGVSIHKQ
jgi:hypothetical protein